MLKVKHTTRVDDREKRSQSSKRHHESSQRHRNESNANGNNHPPQEYRAHILTLKPKTPPKIVSSQPSLNAKKTIKPGEEEDDNSKPAMPKYSI